MTSDMVKIRIMSALKYNGPQFEHIDSKEPTLQEIINQYYSRYFCSSLADKLTEQYMELWTKQLTEMIDVETSF